MPLEILTRAVHQPELDLKFYWSGNWFSGPTGPRARIFTSREIGFRDLRVRACNAVQVGHRFVALTGLRAKFYKNVMLLQALMGPCRAKICGDEQAVFPQLLRRLSLQLPSAKANCDCCQRQPVENVSLVVITERPLLLSAASTRKCRKLNFRLAKLCAHGHLRAVNRLMFKPTHPYSVTLTVRMIPQVPQMTLRTFCTHNTVSEANGFMDL